jgi:hypothetical protein
MNVLRVRSSPLCLYLPMHINFKNLSVLPYIVYMVYGCNNLSNSLLVGVHNIPKARLLMELDMRRIPIQTKGTAASKGRACLRLIGKATVGAHVAKYFSVRGRGDVLHRGSVSAFRDDNDGGIYTIHYEDGDRELMDTHHEFQFAYNLAKDEDDWENA